VEPYQGETMIIGAGHADDIQRGGLGLAGHASEASAGSTLLRMSAPRSSLSSQRCPPAILPSSNAR
jgi:hypothetical protein